LRRKNRIPARKKRPGIPFAIPHTIQPAFPFILNGEEILVNNPSTNKSVQFLIRDIVHPRPFQVSLSFSTRSVFPDMLWP